MCSCSGNVVMHKATSTHLRREWQQRLDGGLGGDERHKLRVDQLHLVHVLRARHPYMLLGYPDSPKFVQIGSRHVSDPLTMHTAELRAHDGGAAQTALIAK